MTGPGSRLTDRGALYYPFIHVRDENWLKATLLCFPFVDRMVPPGYEVNDGPVASAFVTTSGRFGSTHPSNAPDRRGEPAGVCR